jgi:hypothetical protein
MKRKFLIGLLFVTQLVTSQNFQTVDEVDEACATLGFMGNQEAEYTVDRILSEIGLFRNFVLQECPNINNAVAKNIESKNGHKIRYILYDNDFFTRINDKAANDWAAISILAHEIGHHLNGHSLNNRGSNHKFELEADYFSGLSLAKMGATLEQAQSAIQTFKYEKATRTHPAKADRLAQIEKGWRFVNKEIKKKETLEVVEEDVPFAVIENVPVFPGCSGTNAEKKKCMGLKIKEHIGRNFNANIASEIGLQSKCLDEKEIYNSDTGKYEKKCNKWMPIRIVSQFTITKDGYISIDGIRAPHTRLQEETKRVLMKLPKMVPGIQRGENVNVKYALPIAFVVEGY